jgi:hypothetical protein
MAERQPLARYVDVNSAALVGNASARRPAVRRRGVVVTRPRCRSSHHDPHGHAPCMNAQRVRRARSVSNTARTAAASAAVLAQVDFAQRVTNQWLSPIFLPTEVIAQSHPDSPVGKSHGRQRGEIHDRVRGDLTAAAGEVHMTVDSQPCLPSWTKCGGRILQADEGCELASRCHHLPN